jgi:DNA helicase-2/ATP-dependent DNA helicase PcrA
LNKKSAVSVAKFVALMDRLREHATAPVEEVFGHVLAETGYHDLLAASELAEDQERLANIEELLTAAREFDMQHPGDGHLQEFLEQSSLASDTDAFEGESDAVTLMTLHAAKGLEFPVVFIIALEEGIIPHERSQNQQDLTEEERRLLFVGITRAEEELQLSHVERRLFRGREQMPVPSSFLMELPRSEMEVVAPSFGYYQQTAWRQREGQGDAYEGDESQTSGWDDFDFSQDEPAAKPRGKGTKLITAAEMLVDDEAAQRCPPSVFRQGMAVNHPTYGAGVIVALSGTSRTRTATVQFHSTASQKKFRLAQSPLMPAEGET